MTNTQTPFVGLFDTKFIQYYSSFVVVKKRETEYEKWVNHFRLTETNKLSWKEREQTQTLILSFLFSVVILTHTWSGLQLCSVYGTPLQSSPKKGAVIFNQSSHHVLCPTHFLFWFSILLPSNNFSVWVSSSQSQLIANLLLIHFLS